MSIKMLVLHTLAGRLLPQIHPQPEQQRPLPSGPPGNRPQRSICRGVSPALLRGPSSVHFSWPLTYVQALCSEPPAHLTGQQPLPWPSSLHPAGSLVSAASPHEPGSVLFWTPVYSQDKCTLLS
ncbi:hypothetical protein H1C71_036215 [Ictidomys tridecemlineatus]|nr:hypothetical protein H1C71_036215 [Ictidomys tridecemlineatus]KAG3293701.1 hypothetical protein H1C71_036215 [Ictidomys tridecemlineatus]KAG3293702.1 hypothetical protein H1C71_036215 [Ictidomys tridecemlineatus]KAG3293703.1 hypothetical protein H1C71_036215 [Ictidomys tridecemlineatus]KAG3293704.1 hypothetical protein H1C71_036215 [Ictidomys tridecemlineatus]